MKSMDMEERWLIEEYYGKGKSIDTLLEMQREKASLFLKAPCGEENCAWLKR